MTNVCNNLLEAAVQVQVQSDERRRAIAGTMAQLYQAERFSEAAKSILQAASPGGGNGGGVPSNAPSPVPSGAASRPRIANGSQRSYSPAPKESVSLACRETMASGNDVAAAVTASQEKAMLQVFQTGLFDLATAAAMQRSPLAI